MAQYLPFIPDAFPEPVIYAPDFNFFDKMLQRKQLQYEQGVNQAKAAYRSVYDAPLTNKFNIPLKDQYLKQAQEGLKKIAASDLSLPQNQQVAQSLYAPFWEDKFILQDANLTKWYQSQAQKLDSWRTSSDPKVREQYNGIVSKYLSNGLDVLRDANRDPASFNQVEKREAIPWTNIESYLEKAANDQKMSIKYDEAAGPYLISTENGERSKQKFSVWAQSMIGNNFYQQFNVSGIVEKEERVKNIKRNPEFLKRFPNATNQDVLNFMSNDVIQELQYGYKKRNDEIDVELARVNSLINSMPPVLDDDGQRMMKALASEKQQLLAKRDGINQEYKNFDQPNNIDRIKSNLLTNPDSYFATLAKQRVINNWATGRAAIEGRTIKQNQAWSDAEKLQVDKARLELDKVKVELDREKEQRERIKTEFDMNQTIWERTNAKPGTTSSSTKPKTKIVKDANGNDVEVIDTDYTDSKTTGVYKGLGTTDITKTAETGVALDIFNKAQKNLFTGAYDMMFDVGGLLSIAKKELGLTQEDISKISTYYKKVIKSNKFDPAGPELNIQPSEAAALDKPLYNLLSKLLENENVKKLGYATNEDIKDPGKFAQALSAFSADYLTRRNKGIGELKEPPFTEEELQAMIMYSQAKINLETYHANENNRKELLNKTIVNDPKYKSIVRNGELIKIDDLAKDMPEELEIFHLGKPGSRILKKDELASLFMRGQLSTSNNGNFIVDGVNYYIHRINNTVASFSNGPIAAEYAWNNYYNKVLVPKYGESQDFSKLIKEAETSIVPNLLYYQQKTGSMGAEWSYNFDENKNQDLAYNIFNTALSPANGVIYDQNTAEIISTDKMDKIRGLLADKEKNAEKYIQGFTYKTLTAQGGKPAIQFTIPTTDETKDIAGTYNIVVNPETNTMLSGLPQNTGQYIYGDLLRGKTVKSDPVMSASGFSYELVPSNMDPVNPEPEKVHLTLNYNVVSNQKDANGVIKNVIKTEKVEKTFNLKGDNAKSPDEIVKMLTDLYVEQMTLNHNTRKEYQSYLKAQMATPQQQASPTAPRVISKADMMKQLGL